MMKKSTALLLASTLFGSCSSTYNLVTDYSGEAFFNGFTFFSGADPTNGHVKYVDMQIANATGLAGFLAENNSPGPVYLGVDSTNVTPNGRPSVRVVSNITHNHALWIVDISHMPGGICGTWPAFWLLGLSSEWPKAGEIDIIEGVNDQAMNKMTLHTNAGVQIDNSTDLMKGQLITSNCDVNAINQDKNAGCLIQDPANLTSFGTGFNTNGGGVFATEYTSTGITIWFFPRGSIPDDITAGTPNPNADTWGLPNALFAGENIDFDGHFCEMQIVFDTTFCGDWAGKTWSTSSCASQATTCEDFVTNNPAAFKDAYWAIDSLQVYEQADAPSGSSTNTSSTYW